MSAGLIWWVVAVVDMEDMEDTEFTNTWVAEIHGGESIARRVARDHGYVYEGPVSASRARVMCRPNRHAEAQQVFIFNTKRNEQKIKIRQIYVPFS